MLTIADEGGARQLLTIAEGGEGGSENPQNWLT